VKLSHGERIAWDFFILFYGFEIICNSYETLLYYFHFINFRFWIIFGSNKSLNFPRFEK